MKARYLYSIGTVSRVPDRVLLFFCCPNHSSYDISFCSFFSAYKSVICVVMCSHHPERRAGSRPIATLSRTVRYEVTSSGLAECSVGIDASARKGLLKRQPASDIASLLSQFFALVISHKRKSRCMNFATIFWNSRRYEEIQAPVAYGLILLGQFMKYV